MIIPMIHYHRITKIASHSEHDDEHTAISFNINQTLKICHQWRWSISSHGLVNGLGVGLLKSAHTASIVTASVAVQYKLVKYQPVISGIAIIIYHNSIFHNDDLFLEERFDISQVYTIFSVLKLIKNAILGVDPPSTPVAYVPPASSTMPVIEQSTTSNGSNYHLQEYPWAAPYVDVSSDSLVFVAANNTITLKLVSSSEVCADFPIHLASTKK